MLLLQADYYSSSYSSSGSLPPALAFFMGGVGLFVGLAFLALMLISWWKIFTKAGVEGWKAIIPIYNIVVLLQIVGKPWWWVFLFFVPCVNYVFIIWTYNMLSKSFGKEEGFTVGLILLGFIFFPILAFSDAKYIGPYGDQTQMRAFQQRDRGFDFEQQNP